MTSMSVSVVFWGLFGFLYGGLDSVHTLFCVRLKRGFVNGWRCGLVSVSDVVNFRLETVITPKRVLFRCSSLRRVYVDYYFGVALGAVAVWVLMPNCS